ncbi:MAG: hypothetical protein IVW57_15315, partial [Ktedonobacterales bacterium]|nr:hypothetical protein [Ktedonobacterales bacterium]
RVAASHRHIRTDEFERAWRACAAHGSLGKWEYDLSEYLRLVPPTPDYAYRHRHPARTIAFLTRLDACLAPENRKVLLLRGYRGSALHRLPKVLADVLAAPDPALATRFPWLAAYKTVYRLDVTGVLNLVTEADGPDPDAVLALVQQKIAKQHACETSILFLKDVKVLDVEKPRMHMDLWAALTAPSQLAIIGMYGTERHTEPTAAFLDGNPHDGRVTHLLVSKHNAGETRLFLRRQCAARWAEHGFVFEEDAFDSLMAFEPGACVFGARKTLPYLARDLGDHTILTALSDDPKRAFEEMIESALAAVEQHLKWNKRPEIRARFAEELERAKQDILALQRDPVPATKRQEDGTSVRVLTRCHVITQFLCPNQSHFNFDLVDNPPVE